MRTLKSILEKPAFIWTLITIAYCSVFWSSLKGVPIHSAEEPVVEQVARFSETSFPPKIDLVRSVSDIAGHLGFYAIYGQVYSSSNGSLASLRITGLVLVLLSFLIFIKLGYRYTYRNRLSPLWISLGLLVLAANPYAWIAAFQVNYMGLLLLFLLSALYFYEKEFLGLASISVSLAILTDWRALILAVAFVVTRMMDERSRLVRPERMIALALPFAIAALPFMAWHGPVPQGEVRESWATLIEKRAFFRLDAFFYALALSPLYVPWFSWSWGLRARTRSLVAGLIVAGVLVPLYFLFPIRGEFWAEVADGANVALGLVDLGAMKVAGPYKNLLLFVPFFVGAFLFAQALLMDVLDRSRCLRYFILLFFFVQPFVIGPSDFGFLILIPFVILLSLSEAFVGEEGKLS